MTVREDIAHLAPAARRYARGLVAQDCDDRAEAADLMLRESIQRASRGDWSGRHSSLKISLYVTITALNRARLRGGAAARTSGGEDAPEPARSSGAGSRAGGVTQSLDSLACEEREALLLIAVERLDYAQACEILNIPRPALIARLARARRALAERLDRPSAHERAVHERARRPAASYLRVVK
jgi:RNA polymerase sigma-70 factor (ECF subfamily)